MFTNYDELFSNMLFIFPGDLWVIRNCIVHFYGTTRSAAIHSRLKSDNRPHFNKYISD